jgi:hypothetical protein
VDLVEQWHHVLQLLNLPDTPQVLVAAPDREDAVLAALHRARPSAKVVVLDVGGARDTRTGAVAQRVRATGPAMGSLIAADSIDLALLDHAIDDVVLEAVARHEGMKDEGHRGEYAPKARAVRAYWRSGDLERVALPELAELVSACARALRPSGCIVFSHRVMGEDLLGQPMDLYTDYLALTRRWLLSAGLRLREASLDGLDPHWWMCLERTG